MRFAAWGALAGLMLSLIPATMVGLGLATPRADLGIWRITATIAGLDAPRCRVGGGIAGAGEKGAAAGIARRAGDHRP